ncbi:hypothetical protein VE01_06517 [Pseudogymnoascus verrucosus]|uniref:Fumarylacetoacetase-like C-terminal domain-containing protein n=1 Tax=Pseudogymnoascus verrucosus TaxID=342668 RepID=A0A1B8GIL6_9PEZI|nr:uncharacterized protein VE01_06517 [Pseudogymnoascus verrucosus]OBT95692.2 hypothetical protein VE01_06517 [Pseudogymnoascus verrucosus]
MPSATAPDLPIWNRFVRFIGEDGNEYCGEPVDSELDVGLAMEQNEPVMVKLLNGISALDFDVIFTGRVVRAREILTPITPAEAGTIRCIGLNYTDHAAEMKLALPTNPEVFFKPSTCLNAPSSPIHLPALAASSADLEVELAVVLGADAKDVSATDAMQYVLGYMTANDVTARAIQERGSQWGYCKGFDGFAPVGPVLVSRRVLPDPSVLELRSTLNERVMQDGRARNMIFTIAEIVAYLSVGTTLKKGTVILTGTPCGIGHSYKPPVYLQEGDTMKIWISHGLGTLTNPIV